MYSGFDQPLGRCAPRPPPTWRNPADRVDVYRDTETRQPVNTGSQQTALGQWLPGFIIVGILWGCSFLFIKVSLTDFTPVGVGIFRQVLGAVALVTYSLVTKTPFVRDRAVWRHTFVVALLLNAVPGLLFAAGETLINSSLAGILNATTPLMTALAIASVFRSEHINFSQVCGLILGFFGVVVLSGQLIDPQSVNLGGVALCLGATTCYGLGMPYIRRYLGGTSYSATSLTTAQLIAAATLTTPLLALPTGVVHSAAISPMALGSLLVLGIFGTGFAYIMNYRTVRLAGSAVASTVTYFSPVVAALVGAIFLGEALHWYVLAGAGLVLVSAAMVQKRLRLWPARANQTAP